MTGASISHARPSIKQGRSAMTTRREVIFAAVAGAAMLTRISSALAATYDLVIKGGRVIDPAARVNAMRDVAIVGGRIAAIESNIAGDGAQMLDARGKLVVPGLIDVHTHAARAREMAAICLADGGTGFVDAGSAGADKIDDVVANAKSAPNRGRVLINLARTGVTPDGELNDMQRADVALARAAIERHRDTIIGVKARLSFNVVGPADLDALKPGQEVAGDLPGEVKTRQTGLSEPNKNALAP